MLDGPLTTEGGSFGSALVGAQTLAEDEELNEGEDQNCDAELAEEKALGEGESGIDVSF